MEERILNRNKLLKGNVHNITENYNNGQYDNVLNGFPGFYESLSICLICDSESSINDANEIVKGNWQWIWGHHNRYEPYSNSFGRLESSSTISAAKNSVLKKLFDTKQETEYKNLYKYLNGIFVSMESSYNLIKQISPGSHSTNATGKYDYKTLADAEIANLSKFREIAIKEGIISEDTKSSLNDLVIKEKEEEDTHYNSEIKDAYDAKIEIEKLTNYFDSSKRYVLIAPPVFKDYNGNRISNDFLLHLFKISWSMVIDFNDLSDNGLYDSLPDTIKNKYFEIKKIGENKRYIPDYVPNGISKSPWVFANGTEEKSCQNDMDKWIDENYPQFVKNVFDRMHQFESDYVFISFYDNSEIIEELIREFDRDFFKEKCNHFITICNGNDDFEKDMHKIRGYDIKTLKLDSFQFILNLWGYHRLYEEGTPIILKSSNGKTIDLTNRINDFKDMGFEIVNDNTDSEEKKWNFYQGAEITWTELKDDKDVKRDGLYQLTNEILSIIKQKSSKPREYVMGYSAGSGSTTMARRLGYDIFKKNLQKEFGDKVCVVMFLHDYNRRTTNAGLVNLSMELDNDPILVFCDYCDVQDSEYDNLKEYCHDRNIVFFRLLPNEVSRKKNFNMPEVISRKDDWDSFARKYGDSFGNSEEVKKKLSEMGTHFEKEGKTEVIEFPLHLEDNASDNLKEYVKAKFYQLPSENLKNFCKMVAFGYLFSRSSVNPKLFRNLLLDVNDREYQENVLLDNLKYLLIKDESKGLPFWRPRYPQFAEWILDVASGGSWDSVRFLTLLAKEFINNCYDNLSDGNENELEPLALIFAKRREDFRKDTCLIDSDVDLKKFSPYIQKVGVEKGERILQQLVDYWPDYPYFSVHYARLLFERAAKNKEASPDDADYEKAGELIENALKANGNSDEIWHVRGMRYMRMIKSLRNKFSTLKDKDKKEDVINYLNKLKEYVNNAQDSFIQCEMRNPLSSYGYTSEASMYHYALQFAKDIKQKDNYEFVLDEYPWYEYLERFEEVIGRMKSFHDINYETQKDTNLHFKEITGNPRDVLYRYYAEAISDSNSSEKRIRYGSFYNRLFMENRSLEKLGIKDYEKLYDLYQKNAEICQDVKSYQRWFDLLRYGNEPVSFEEAIKILEDWKSLCEDKLPTTKTEYEHQQLNRSLLNANFYLCVCLTCKFIIEKTNSFELCRKIKDLKGIVKQMADSNPELKNTLFYHRCYLKIKDETDDNMLHYVGNYQSAEDEKENGLRIEGVYYSENNKGYILLDNDLSVTFYDLGRNSDVYAQGKHYKGVIVFKYGGTGMHEAKLVEKVPSNNIGEGASFDEVAETDEELSNSDSPKVAVPPSDNDAVFKNTPELKAPKTVKFHGELIIKYGRKSILCKEDNREYVVTYDLNDPNLYDGQSVVFEIKVDVSNPKNPNFKKAINIQVDDDF